MNQDKNSMMTAKLLIVSPRYCPSLCGVGEYSRFLREHLQDADYSTDVYTSGTDEEADRQPGVFRCSEWSLGTVRTLAEFVRKHEYTHVLLQYVPMAYSKKGAFPAVAWLPCIIKSIYPQCRVISTLHELFYVSNLAEIARIPRNLTVGSAQRMSLLAVLKHSDALIVTTKERYQFVSCLHRLFGWSDTSTISEIPVGTNVEPIQLSSVQKNLDRHKHGFENKLVLGSFSNVSQPKMLLAALAATREAGLPAHLLLVGSDASRLRSQASNLYSALAPYIVCTDKLPAAEVSRCLQLIDLYLLPLLDGVSSRRGTLTAALAHGLAIVGTHGRSTDDWMRHAPALCLTRAGDRYAFTEAVVQIAQHPEQQQKLQQEAALLFQERFTWGAITHSYEKLIRYGS